MKADPRRARFGAAYFRPPSKASTLEDYLRLATWLQNLQDQLVRAAAAMVPKMVAMQQAYLAAMATKMANGLATFQLEYTPILKTPTPEERTTP